MADNAKTSSCLRKETAFNKNNYSRYNKEMVQYKYAGW